MQRHGQTVFLIESLQPSWLASRRQRQVYTLGTRVIGGAILGLIVGLVVGVWDGFVAGIVAGLCIAVFDIGLLAVNGERTTTLAFTTLSVVGKGLLVWLVVWLFGMVVGRSFDGFVLGSIYGIVFAVTFGARNRGDSLSDDVRTVETLSWSSTRAVRYGVLGLLLGILTGIIGEVFFRLAFGQAIAARPDWWLGTGVLFGMVGGISAAILGGLHSGVIETKTAPNQGIRMSFRNSIYAGLIAGAVVGVLGVFTGGFLGNLLANLGGIRGLQGGLGGGLTAGLTAGLLVASWYGGLNMMQHYMLRGIMFAKGYMPVNYARFLDYTAEELNFLQKVGGGYMFVHRYLLEYFAAMEPPGQPAASDRHDVSQPAVNTVDGV